MAIKEKITADRLLLALVAAFTAFNTSNEYVEQPGVEPDQIVAVEHRLDIMDERLDARILIAELDGRTGALNHMHRHGD